MGIGRGTHRSSQPQGMWAELGEKTQRRAPCPLQGSAQVGSFPSQRHLLPVCLRPRPPYPTPAALTLGPQPPAPVFPSRSHGPCRPEIGCHLLLQTSSCESEAGAHHPRLSPLLTLCSSPLETPSRGSGALIILPVSVHSLTAGPSACWKAPGATLITGGSQGRY